MRGGVAGVHNRKRVSSGLLHMRRDLAGPSYPGEASFAACRTTSGGVGEGCVCLRVSAFSAMLQYKKCFSMKQ